jgi:hypothetical protein
MSRICLALTTGLAVALVTACSRSGEADLASPSSDVVVTGTRTADANYAPVNVTAAEVGSVSSAVPPPPAMAAPVVTGRAGAAKAVMPRGDMMMPYYQDVGRDKFTSTPENGFKIAREDPVSTFSIDVDTASYAFVRASLNQQCPAATCRGAHRRADQLFSLRLRRAAQRATPFHVERRGLSQPVDRRRPQARPRRDQGLCGRARDAAARQPRIS